MAKMVNVNREVVDAFYRYKMPLLCTKVEGRGNGIKTVIPNMVEVAKALARPPSYPTKFFGCELGAQVQMQVEAERYIVNGQHETQRFQELLDEFIKKFVLCPDCQNPETVLRVTSKKQIEQKCKACGYVGTLPMIHRLTTYIVNNPPNEVKSKSKGLSKEERRAAKNKKLGRGEKKSKGDDEDGADDQASLGQVGAQVDAAKARLGGKIDAPDAVDDAGDDDDWSVDVSEAAVRERTQALGTGVTHLTQTDDLERSLDERLEIFSKYCEERVSLAKFPAKEVVGEAERLECKDKGTMVLVGVLITKADDVFASFKLYQGLFQRFAMESPKAQKYLLGAVEKLIEARPELLAKCVRLFKTLYDLDILDEEVILTWGQKVSKKYVKKDLAEQIHAKCKPFLEWLAEAEEEESEDEDDMVFAANPEAVLAADAAKAAEEAGATSPEPEDDDDLDDEDIDNM